MGMEDINQFNRCHHTAHRDGLRARGLEAEERVHRVFQLPLHAPLPQPHVPQLLLACRQQLRVLVVIPSPSYCRGRYCCASRRRYTRCGRHW